MFKMGNVKELALWLMLLTVLQPRRATAYRNTISIGGIFKSHQDDLQDIFRIAVQSRNESQYLFDSVSSKLPPEDKPSQLQEELCRQMAQGISSLVISVPDAPDKPVASYSNAYRLPRIAIGRDRRFDEYGVSLRPDTLQAVMDVIRYYGWQEVIYLHDSEQGKYRFRTITSAFPNHIIAVYQVTNTSDTYESLRHWFSSDRSSPKNIILDMDEALALRIVAETKTENLHFILTSLTTRTTAIPNMVNSTVSVTELRLLQQPESNEGPMSIDTALVHDAVEVISDALNRMVQQHPTILERHQTDDPAQIITPAEGLDCGVHTVQPSETGQFLIGYLKETKIQGLTGFIEFDDVGLRKEFALEVVESRRGILRKVASWTDTAGLQLPIGRHRRADPQSKTLIVTTILEEPFMMLKDGYSADSGNDRYEGYCKDLLDLLGNMLDFTYSLQRVADGRYGSITPEGGRWTGMIGEVIRKEADMAVAPLTITSQRSQVVDFTSPFINVGISLMIKKPASQDSILQSHPLLSAFSAPVWVCVLLAYFTVLVVLYIIARISPAEFYYRSHSEGNGVCSYVRHFIGTACNLCPRSIGGKIVSHVWWFFVLVVACIYIAHVLAFLTLPSASKVVPPISGVSELVKRPDIQYGALVQSSTLNFFRTSKVPLYAKMWEAMSANSDVLVASYDEGIQRVRESGGSYVFLMESTKNDYINHRQPCDTMKVGGLLDNKGYGIAIAKNSPLRTLLDSSILRLQETGDLAMLYRKWWYDREECPEMKDNESTKLSGVTLRGTAECFYFLICGIVVGLVVAGVDYCFATWMNEKGEKAELATRGSQAKRAKEIVESCKSALIEHSRQLSDLQQHLNQQ